MINILEPIDATAGLLVVLGALAMGCFRTAGAGRLLDDFDRTRGGGP